MLSEVEFDRRGATDGKRGAVWHCAEMISGPPATAQKRLTQLDLSKPHLGANNPLLPPGRFCYLYWLPVEAGERVGKRHLRSLHAPVVRISLAVV